LQNWKKNRAKFRQIRGQDKNGVYGMTFTNQCIVCGKILTKSKRVQHLNTHTKTDLIESVKDWGYYDHE